MTTAVQHRRGTTAEHAVFTGLEGEVTIDTTKDTAVIHDGSLAGGYPLAKESLANVNPGALSAITGSATAADDVFLLYDTSATSMKKITRAELNNAIEADALASVTITGGTINGTSVGASTPSTGAFTTLSTSGATTLSGGTANGVTYLNGSKVLTSGSALTFDGTNLATTGKINIGSPAATVARLNVQSSNTSLADFVNSGGTTGVFLSTDGTIPVIGSRGGDQGLRLNASGTTSTAVIMFNAGASEGMRLTSTGLGIGTSSPAVKLDVAGTAQITGPNNVFLNLRGAAINEKHVDFYHDSTLAFENYLTGDNSFVWRSRVGGLLERMRIDSSGNVGIGTTIPGAYKLNVAGNVNVTGTVTASGAITGAAGSFTTVSHTGDILGPGTIRSISNSDSDQNPRILTRQIVAGSTNSGAYGYTGAGLIASRSSAAGALLLDVGSNSGPNRLTVTNDGGGTGGTMAYVGALAVTGAISATEIISANKGITFPATQVASADANTLDDYEEGTWTPAYVTTGGVFSYAAQYGQYTKIGNTVYCVMRLYTNTAGNTIGTGAVTISGLPFAVVNDATRRPAFSLGYVWDFGTYAPTAGYIVENTTTINLLTKITIHADATAFDAANLVATKFNQIYATFFYQTA